MNTMKWTSWKGFKYLPNKYILTLILFGVWITFLNSNNLILQYKLRRNKKELVKEKAFYIQEIKKNREALYLLENDKDHLERLAREKFLMKRDNEDIFIFVK